MKSFFQQLLVILVILAVLGTVMFGIARCSRAMNPPEEQRRQEIERTQASADQPELIATLPDGRELYRIAVVRPGGRVEPVYIVGCDVATNYVEGKEHRAVAVVNGACR